MSSNHFVQVQHATFDLLEEKFYDGRKKYEPEPSANAQLIVSFPESTFHSLNGKCEKLRSHGTLASQPFLSDSQYLPPSAPESLSSLCIRLFATPLCIGLLIVSPRHIHLLVTCSRRLLAHVEVMWSTPRPARTFKLPATQHLRRPLAMQLLSKLV